MNGRASMLITLARYERWKNGAEIGVWQGATLFALLDACPLLSMVGVDHWTAQPFVKKSKDTGDAPYTEQSALDEARGNVLRQAVSYGSRCHIMNQPSIDAAQMFTNELFDFVFIDADHKTESVLADYNAWAPRVRRNGMVLGHDADWPSVMRATDQIGGVHRTKTGNIWMKRV